MTNRFKDRIEAGRLLAAQLEDYAGRPDVIVVGLARGGIPVARVVADALNAPLNVLVVRKLGLPSQPELAIGALASGWVRILDDDLINACRLSTRQIEAITAHEQAELERRDALYRQYHAPLCVHGKCVILVDDGMATGMTMRAAIHALAQQQPRQIVVAVPVAARETCDAIEHDPRFSNITTCVCALKPDVFRAVALWYEDFPQVGDEEVYAMLDRCTT